MTRSKPKIAVMMDENTSGGGTHYEMRKDYYSAIAQAGGVPYGIPYIKDFSERVVAEFDGFLSVGGAIAFPSDWYVSGCASPYPFSERLAVETKIMQSFLDADKPFLGVCHGMQLMAALYGGKLRSDLADTLHKNSHHSVFLTQGSRLAEIVGCTSLEVNSRHSEAVATILDPIQVSAVAADGVIEALEIKGKKFAVGIQWHQENFWQVEHAGNRIFSAFVEACEA